MWTNPRINLRLPISHHANFVREKLVNILMEDFKKSLRVADMSQKGGGSTPCPQLSKYIFFFLKGEKDAECPIFKATLPVTC